MEHKRKFIIQIIDNEHNPGLDLYVWNVIQNSIGYFWTLTKHTKKAKVWKYKKNCEKSIHKLENRKDPTKKQNYIYSIIEITDNQTLRQIKLKKLNKK